MYLKIKDAIFETSSFRIIETDAEIEARMEKWDNYLEHQDGERAQDNEQQ